MSDELDQYNNHYPNSQKKIPKVTASDIGKISDDYDLAHGLNYPLPPNERVVTVVERLLWAFETGKIDEDHYDAYLRIWTNAR